MSDNVTLSSSAAERVLYLIDKEDKPGAMLRIQVDGGGCSGFQYHFDFVYESDDDDTEIKDESSNTTLAVVDPVSLDFLKGAVLDYENTLGSSAFVVKNPNATASCGCGNSFAV